MKLDSRFAILVGTNAYIEKKLSYTLKDVDDMKSILIERCQFQEEYIEVLKFETEDCIDCVQKVKDAFRKIKTKGFTKNMHTLLFYYSGHGTYEKESKKSFLVLSDKEDISIQEIWNQIEVLSGKHQYMFIDACHSGGDIDYSLKNKNNKKIRTYNYNSKSIYCIFGASQNEVAYEIESKKYNICNGMLTHYIIDALRDSRNYNPDGCISVKVIDDHVSSQSFSKFKQISVSHSKSEGYHAFGFWIEAMEMPKYNENLNSGKAQYHSLLENLEQLEIKKNSLTSSKDISKEDYNNYAQVIRRLRDEIENQFTNPIRSSINLEEFRIAELFESVMNSPDIKGQLRVDVNDLLDKKKYKWHERSAIISAISLSVIKNFTSSKIDLLISFLLDFEEPNYNQAFVWQRALVGLVLALQCTRKWERDQELKKRLMKLCNHKNIQDGLMTIDAIIRYKFYTDSFLSPKTLELDFFKNNPLYCFLPFYEKNQKLEDAIDSTPSNDYDFEVIEKHLYHLPLTNIYKYSLAEALKSGQLVVVPLEGTKAQKYLNELYRYEYLNPYKNLVTEFYHFFSYHPTHKIDVVFNDCKSITQTETHKYILDPKNLLFIEAKILLESNAYSLAFNKISSYIDKYGQDIPAIEIQAISLWKQKKFEDSECYYNKIIKQETNNILWYIEFSKKLEAELFFEKAIYYQKLAIKIEPQNIDIINDIGHNYVKIQQYAKAKEYFLLALKINSQDINALNGLGMMYDRINKDEESLHFFQEALSYNSNNFYTLHNLGIIYSKLKQFKYAVQYHQLAYDVDSENANNANSLAIALRNIKEFNKAVVYHTKAIMLYPDFYFVHELAKTYSYSGNNDTALNIMLRLLKKNRKYAPLLWDIGIVYRRLGNFDKKNEYEGKATMLAGIVTEKDNPDSFCTIAITFNLEDKSTQEELRKKFEDSSRMMEDL